MQYCFYRSLSTKRFEHYKCVCEVYSFKKLNGVDTTEFYKIHLISE